VFHSPNARKLELIIFGTIAKSLIFNSVNQVWKLLNTSIPNNELQGINPITRRTNNRIKTTISGQVLMEL